MGKPLGDDLRRRLLLAYDQGEGTLEALADRFLVSVGWAKKISAARNRTGQAERLPHKPGRKPHAGIKAQQQVRTWFAEQSDLTLAEVQQKLLGEADVSLSLPSVYSLWRDSATDTDMGKPLGDDLRRRLLLAYDQGEGTLEALADRFLVSVGWAKKISAARNRTGQAERLPHKPGRKPHAGIKAQQQVRTWFAEQSDLTLAEVQQKLLGEADVSLSLPQIWKLLRKLGLRLKKSRSTPLSGIPKPIVNSVRSLSLNSRRSLRNT